jgi:hypothetical protein
MWDETTANLGSDEIGSCILKFVETFPNKCNYLVIYSGNYPGEN